MRSFTYILMAVAIYTACNLAYNTLLSLEAPDPKDRVTMSSIRFFVTMSVVLFINYNCNNLVGKFGWTGIGSNLWYNCYNIAFDHICRNKRAYTCRRKYF